MEQEVQVTMKDRQMACRMIFTLRHMSDFTPPEFGQRFGLSQTQVSRIETMKDMPSDDLMRRICDRYSIDLDQLLLKKPVNKWAITA